jgi:hypothetical protein
MSKIEKGKYFMQKYTFETISEIYGLATLKNISDLLP